jgi:flagellar basal-body rod modification protein FlgD
MVDAISAIGTAAELSKAQTDKTTLAGDLDAFLLLLTTQLQNQDPRSPLEPTEFTGQLVQFASVEQQIATNKSMEDLLTVQNASLAASVVGFIGTDVEASGTEMPLQNGSAEFTYTLAQNAKNTDVTILDSKGAVVLNAQGSLKAGAHEFKWDGKDNYGNTMAEGAYTINVNPMDFDEQVISTTISFKAHVTGVNMSSGDTLLEAGNVSIPLDKILAIKESKTATTEAE